MASARALSLPLQSVRRKMDGVNNGLIITANPCLFADSQDRLKIILREANHRGFALFLFHTIMVTSCILLVNVLYSVQYLENSITYGFSGEGPEVKTLPCFPMYQAI